MEQVQEDIATPEARLRVANQIQYLLAKVVQGECDSSELRKIRNALSLINDGNFSFLTETQELLPALVLNFFKDNPKKEIYIFGHMRIPDRQIEGIVKGIGIPFERVKKFIDVDHQGRSREVFDGFITNPHIGAIIFGPTPHSMPRSDGMGYTGYQKILNERRPEVITRLITSASGQVKITKESLKKTLKEVAKSMVLNVSDV